MSFVHCMICFCLPAKDSKFYFSSCAHVACVRCVEKGCFLLKCKICQKENPRILEINAQLKPEVADLFMPIESSLKKLNDDMSRILDFQSMHRNRLIDQLYGKTEMFNKLRDYCQSEIKKKEAYKQEVVQLMNHKKQADTTIEKLMTQINTTTVNMSSMNISKGNMNLTAMTHDPFRTPAPRGGHRSFITSTPMPDVSMSDKSSIDASLSFSAATGLPKINDTMDAADLSALASRTQAVDLNGSAPAPVTSTSGGSGSKRRACAPESAQNDFSSRASATRSTQQPISTSKVPASKKTRLDILAKTQPLPMK